MEAIGPLKAVKAMNIPVSEIAGAIESRDVDALKKLKGIGSRTAQKIVATLEGKMGKFALIREADRKPVPEVRDIEKQVMDVLVSQLGHKPADARRMITDALKRDPAITSAEAAASWFKVGGPAEVLFSPADEDVLAQFLKKVDPAIPVTVATASICQSLPSYTACLRPPRSIRA